MSSARQLHLGAFMRPASIHTGAWRYPGAWPDMNFNFAHMMRCIQALERAKFDAFFMADHMAVLNTPLEALKRSHTVTSFEPFTLLSALSQVTENIGLVATGSTTFDAPFHVARRFASLDHISGGRAGRNIVTTAQRAKCGLGKPETFNFLGFTFICKSRQGKFLIHRKTRRDRMKAKLRDIKEELRWRMHESIPEQGKWLTQVITGFFGYHAVPTNGRAIVAFHHHVTDLWRRSLRRRSQKDRAIELYHRAERLSPYDPSDG